MLAGTAHFTAPLLDGNIMRFHIEKEHNPAVARQLPCDVWRVVIGTPMLDAASQAQGRAAGLVPLEEMHVHATFVTKEEANAAGTRLLDAKKAQAGPAAQLHKSTVEGLVSGFVKPGPHSQFKAETVEVHYDNGQITQAYA